MNSGTSRPASRARTRMESLSRKKRVADSPRPGSRMCSRSVAAISMSNSSRAREIHDGVDDLRGAHLLRHGVDFAENIPRPVRVAMLVECEEFDTAPEA